MSRTPLTPVEIKFRLIEWNNLKRLHAKDQKIKADLKQELRLVRAQLATLAAQFEATNEAQAIRIAELEKMVFGRRSKGKDDSSSSSSSSGTGGASKPPRAKSSHRRPIPPENQITNTEQVAVGGCHSCGGPLTDIFSSISVTLKIFCYQPS